MIYADAEKLETISHDEMKDGNTIFIDCENTMDETVSEKEGRTGKRILSS